MTEPPHAYVFGDGSCPNCLESQFTMIAIPKLATGQLYPIIGFCEACGTRLDLRGEPPLEPSIAPPV
jgi:hypothetical protein